MSRQLVIFDWDGTLMDSTGRIVACMQRAATDLGLDVLADRQIRQIIGLGLPEAIASLYPQLDHRGVEAMRARYAWHFVEAEQAPNSLFSGVEEMIGELLGRNAKLAVATGKSRKGLERVWGAGGYGRWFHASRCADETRSKPEPDMVHELLQELDVAPEAAVVVGDTSHDLLMASNAGVAAIGVTWGAHEADQLQACNPLALVGGIGDLRNLLLQGLGEIA